MKKILFITLLSLLLNNKVFGETLKIECTVKYIDERSKIYKVGDKTVWTYDLKSKKFILTDDFIRHYNLTKIEDKFYAQYIRIFRYTGEFIQKTTEVSEDQIKDLLTQDFSNQTQEVYDKVVLLVNKNFSKNKKKKLYWQEYRKDCIKAKKKF